jgi:ABC-type transport system involved in multi-copper enzyme maturation permease subunit
VNGALVIASYALRENLRRRVFTVVLVISAAFLGLFAFGARRVFDDTAELAGPAARRGVDTVTLAGSSLIGAAMFATLFLGCVLAVFLTLGAVRGDAERGLLQPLVVRPVGRGALLVGRFIGAAAVCCGYVAVLFAATVGIAWAVGGYFPDRILAPGLGLVLGVAILAAIGLLASVYLSGTANGILVFMVFGGGLTAGLLGQIAFVIESSWLETVSTVISWLLPFEALYLNGLALLTADAAGVTGEIVRLGPFGGSQTAGPAVWPYALAYLALVAVAAVAAFRRRDL